MRNPSPNPGRRLSVVCLLATLCLAAALTTTTAAQDQTIWDGVYTEEQAARGQRTYDQECAACHLDDLMGDGIAPSLIGSAFFFRWSELSMGDMYTAIRTTMPQGAPASLSPSGYADISAYMLQKNDVPAGSMELPSDTDDLDGIMITEAQ